MGTLGRMSTYDEVYAGLARDFPTLAEPALRCEALKRVAHDEANLRRYPEAAWAAGELVALLADRKIRDAVVDLPDHDHAAFTILGFIQCLEGRIDEAAVSLQRSIGTGSTPVLATFGPSMRLARELLVQGRRTEVLEYLDECRLIWERGDAILDRWEEEIREGRIPDFGASVLY